MTRSIPLGRFLLDDVVGSGGAGIVWRARHQRLELPVAVKVLPPKADRLALHAHKNEVQAVARLHHPHVIALLDAGVVDDEAARAAARGGVDIAAGSPWLAVELASGGDLSGLRPPFSWGMVSDVLRTLLGALAHAHARGVVHKDVKPQNVLLCTDDDVRPGLKLTDFGLALAGDSERLEGGTPLFMAPEQFDAESRDVGPATDLYALGCVAHWLATGAPPFVDGSWRMLAARHVEERPAPIAASFEVPAGFSPWVLRLLEKDPAKRFRCAADADAALAALDPGRAAPPADRLPDGFDDAMLVATIHVDDVRPDAATVMKAGAATEILPPRELAARARSDDALDETLRGAEGRSASQTQPPPLEVGAAAPPLTWRAAAPPLADLRLVEAGLSLWGLRPVPLVGREAERDALWDALRAVHARRAPHVVVVRGASGVGKSRLAEWLAHRALETGAALPLRATFQRVLGRGDGLAGMVARHVQLDALDAQSSAEDERVARARAQAWLSRWLPGADVDARELCALAGRGEGVFNSGEERQGALVRFLAARARERPLLVWLDDVQHGKDALQLVARVIADAPELAALFVVTAVDDLVDVDVDARLRIDELTAHAAVTSVSLAPLEDTAHDELCARLLGGEARGLADELRRRTEGNPLFAVHLVGAWVARGLLEVTDDGLALKRDAHGAGPEELPDALHALWASRIEGAIDDEAGKQALEIAAVLGSAVDLVEWEAAVQEAARGARVLAPFAAASEGGRTAGALLDDVVDAVAGAGLGRRTDAGFAFAHAMVRGSVERRAREALRLAAHHASAAAALAALWGTDTPTIAARMGRHLLAAGAPRAALPALLGAARAAVLEGDVLAASAVLADWETARTVLALPDDDPLVAPGLVLRAQLAQQEGRHDDARALARRAALVAGDDKRRGEALRAEADACVALGLLDEAAARYDEARALAARSGDKLGGALTLRGLGDVAYYRGDMEQAAARYTAVSEVFTAHGRKSDLVTLLWSLGYVEMERGAFAEAERLFLEQRSISRATRDRLGEANAENALGELARREEKLDEAEQRYRTAARIASKSGLSRRWTFRLNLAHTRVVRGDIAGARAIAAELLASNAAKEPMIAVSAWWILAADAAARGDLAGWDRAAGEALALGKSDIVERDLPVVAQRAGDLMAPHDRARAEQAWAFARRKREALQG